ncbi:MAG: ribonuclease H family protein [Clostridiales bacterium]|nr:ribonuclease H family protein [Clostridiales bacterium]
MSKKFYAVRNGRNAGVYTSWDECRRQITGFSGAVYKGFNTEREALAFMALDTAVSAQPFETPATDIAAAYVDGSYLDATKEFSCGIVLFYKNTELRMSEKFFDPDLSPMRNVAGEIKGAEKAMRYCLEKGIKRLEIIHDYEGVARWCTGEWKADKPGTKAYKTFYDSLSGGLSVNFRKVKGHSGDKYNEAADRLARTALGLYHGRN